MASLESQNDEFNWIEAIGLTGASEVKQYWASVNFAMATVTTIGTHCCAHSHVHCA